MRKSTDAKELGFKIKKKYIKSLNKNVSN